MRHLGFMCLDCHIPVPISHMVLRTDQKIYLVGTCQQCGDNVGYELSRLLVKLFDKEPGEPHGDGH